MRTPYYISKTGFILEQGARKMSDNSRCFVAILSSLKSMSQFEPKGNFLRRLKTSAFLINGIINSKSCRLPDIASKCADKRKLPSREKSFSRFFKNKHFSFETFYMPYAAALLEAVCGQTLAVSFDGSTVGRGCIALVAGLVYKKRSLPLCWLVRTGGKGHFPEDMHMELFEQLLSMMPNGKKLVILGDGEFDGANFLCKISKNKHFYVTRTAENRIMLENGETFRMRDLDLGRQEWFHVPNASPENNSQLICSAVIWWRVNYKKPIYLFTNIAPVCEALFWYKKRFTIETFFSDEKSRGFNIHKSHISNPERIARLLVVAALAYLFIIYFGIVAIKKNLVSYIHRTDRCDLSLFKLGCRLLDFYLAQGKKLPKMMQLDLFNQL